MLEGEIRLALADEDARDPRDSFSLDCEAKAIPVPTPMCVDMGKKDEWRRGWDSNPRRDFWSLTRFRVEPGTTTSVPLPD
jgi:hypothetical protein